MSYVGNTPTQQAFTPAVDYFNGTGSQTAFTLSRPVASVAQVEVIVNNVPQNPGSTYTVSGNTITFVAAPSAGTNNVYVRYTSPITQVIQPGQGTVGNAQLVAGSAVANIGYTPVNKAGDTMTGGLTLGGILNTGAIGQIAFPATQNPSSDANTLDDYEEGTWTPTDASGAGLTLTVQSATYTKIGRLVFVQMYVSWPSTANGSSVLIGGLPFTVGTFNNNQYSFITGRISYSGKGQTSGQCTPTTTTFSMFGNGGSANILNNELSGGYVLYSGCYQSN